MKIEKYDAMDDIDDEDLDRLRRKVEFAALSKALDMLDDSSTPATAKASVIRGALTDAAARRHDNERDVSPFEGMSRDDILRAIAVKERELALMESRTVAEDAEIVETSPDRTVFD